jgi:hypothetical protein
MHNNAIISLHARMHLFGILQLFLDTFARLLNFYNIVIIMQ